MSASRVEACLQAAKQLSIAVDALKFTPPVSHVYNPLNYAWAAHAQYLQLWAQHSQRVVFLGMNPGPFGMAQVGVPFGEVSLVRDWIGIQAPIQKPENSHPKRPIEGFDCTRSEVSGRRFWGLFRDEFVEPAAFFEQHFVLNYCPLVFMEASGRNRTPDKLPTEERSDLFRHCDRHLRTLVEHLRQKLWSASALLQSNELMRPARDYRSKLSVFYIPAPPAQRLIAAGALMQSAIASGGCLVNHECRLIEFLIPCASRHCFPLVPTRDSWLVAHCCPRFR